MMKKKLRFAVFSTEFDVRMMFLFILATVFMLGIVSSFFFSIEISDKLFSPIVILSGSMNQTLFSVIFHSFLYFIIFIVIALVFATSYFGFAIFPILIFIKGLFTAITINSLIMGSQYSECFLFYAPLLTIEASLLLIYFSQCILSSLSFFRKAGVENDNSSIFISSFKQFIIVAICMSALAVACGLTQYFF